MLGAAVRLPAALLSCAVPRCPLCPLARAGISSTASRRSPAFAQDPPPPPVSLPPTPSASSASSASSTSSLSSPPASAASSAPAVSAPGVQTAGIVRKQPPPLWHQGHGAGRYLVEALTRACRQKSDAEISSAAHRFLAAAATLDVEDLVFALNRLAHTGKLKRDRAYWQEAAEKLTPRVHEMRGEALGLAANAFASVGVPVPGLMSAISARILEDLGDVPVKSLTLVLNSVQRGPQDDVQSYQLVNQIVGSLPRRLPEMNAQDAALFLSSLGDKTGTGVQDRVHHDGTVLQQLGGSGAEAYKKLPAPAIAQLVQAFARLSMRDQRLLDGFKPLITDRLSSFPPQSVAMVANAYARLTFLDREFLNAISNVAARDLATQNLAVATVACAGATGSATGGSVHRGNLSVGYDHIAVTQLLNAHAKIKVFHCDLFNAAMDWMTPQRIAKCSPQSLAIALHALAKFPELYSGRAERSQLLAVFATFVPEVLHRAKDFTVQNLVNIVQAFSSVGLCELSLLEDVMRWLLARRALWKTQDVANLASSLARIEYFDAAVFSALAAAVPPLCKDFRPDELATLLNALAHFVRQPQRASAGRQHVGNMLVEAVLPAFEAAAERLGIVGGLASSNTFEVALVLNAFAKVRLPDAKPVSEALAELEARAAVGQVNLVTLGLAFSALARLGHLPPAQLERACLSLLSNGDAHVLKNGLDVIRTVGLLNALVRLDAASRRATLWPCLEPLLQHLHTALEGFEDDVAPSKGPERRFRGAGDWNSHTVPTALDAVCMLWCSCSSKTCSVCGSLWWRCIERLLEHAGRLLTRKAGSKGTPMGFSENNRAIAPAEMVVSRQAWQALLLLFHLRLSQKSGFGFATAPLAVIRSCKVVVAQISFGHAELWSDEVNPGWANSPIQEVGARGIAAIVPSDHSDLLQTLDTLLGARPALGASVLGLYSVDMLLCASSMMPQEPRN